MPYKTWADFIKNSFIFQDWTLFKHQRKRISGENEETVARTRICCGWPSYPLSSINHKKKHIEITNTMSVKQKFVRIPLN